MERGLRVIFRNGMPTAPMKKCRQRIFCWSRFSYSAANIDHVPGAGIIHLDAYLFNEKYSYLPKNELGLKPSVEKKLKIKPIGREALFNKDPVETVAYASCDGYITWKYVREIVLDFFISMGSSTMRLLIYKHYVA